MEDDINHKCRILAVTPYAALNKMVADIAKRFENVELEIYEGDLAVGVDIAHRMRNMGFDVILSRGTTALQIEEQVQIPVVDIGYSGYDMYRAVIMGINLLNNPVILVSDNLKEGIQTVCQIMNTDIPILTIKNDYEEQQYIDLLKKIKKCHQDLICYSNVIYIEAKKMGIDSILIASGSESVCNAFEMALKIYKVQIRERKIQALYQKALGETSGMLCLLENNHLIYSNIRQKEQVESVLRQIDTYKMLNVNQDNMLTEISVAEKKKILSVTKLDKKGEYLLCLLQEPIEEIVEDMIIKINEVDKRISELDLYVGKERAASLYENAKRCYKQHIPLYLFGAVGTCKHKIAIDLYKMIGDKNSCFFWLKCIKVQKISLQKFVASLYENMNTQKIIFLDRVEFLNEECQEILLDLCQYSQQLNIQFVSSAENNLRRFVEKGIFSRKLYSILNEFVEIVPPLNSRKEDIQSLVYYYIAKMNLDFNKQVVGINKTAMEYLKEYDWPMNIAQLERVVKTLVIQSQMGRITASDTQKVLDMEKMYYKDGYESGTVSLKGTLHDIRNRIVRQVLEEERMNQTKTAERLGISRATLWKILKEGTSE